MTAMHEPNEAEGASDLSRADMPDAPDTKQALVRQIARETSIEIGEERYGLSADRILNPEEGVDYLIDHYSVLEVPARVRELGTQETLSTEERAEFLDGVKRAHHAKVRKHHPDLLQRVDESYQKQGDHQVKLFQQARDVLEDDEKRAELNAKLEKFDERLISTSGVPIIDPLRKVVDVEGVIAGTPILSGKTAEFLAQDSSGYNEATFEIIRANFEEKGAGDAAARDAYLQQLLSKLSSLHAEEIAAWLKVGVFDPNDLSMDAQSAEDYREKVSEKIDHYKQAVTHGIELMLPAVEESETSETVEEPSETALAPRALQREKMQGQADELFETSKKEIDEVTQKRFEVLDELASLTDFQFFPEQQIMGTTLIFCLAHEGIILRTFEYAPEENVLGAPDEDPFTGNDSNAIGDAAEEVVHTGRSFGIIEMDQKIPLMFQLNHAVSVFLARRSEE